ncbi:MAG TPA: ubiquinone/menaquinone biosynthesis methyltransferase, partial [Saprospiraceae bacterium]|nr:ubiquinone/menaquinone biosynthesis methyltransferase [Saprospiraceae bacterium]
MNQVKPYNNTPESKKLQVTKMFNKIAPVYDFMNRFLSLGIDASWRKKTILEIPRSQESLNLLDVATGTGALAIQISNQYPNYIIKGIDISEGMLALGQARIIKEGLSKNIEFLVGDAEQIPFSNDFFDVVTAAFGVRNFAHLVLGFQDLLRILNSKGQLLILEFTKPRGFIFRPLFPLYFNYILPVIGNYFSNYPNA